MSPSQLLQVLVFLLVLTRVAIREAESVPGQCPAECRCSIDQRGRSTVTCQRGNLRDVIPVFNMAENTKVLVITAPPYRQNSLSLGPIFQGLRNLEDIQITYSGIPNLGEHSFWGLHGLKILNLTRNQLTSLRDTNFRGANALKILDLSHNRIESIPSAAFRHVRQLGYLKLAYNFLPKLVPRIFFGLTMLEHLDISHNPLRELHPDIFSDVSLLRTLKCAGCELTTLSSTLLETVSELRELDLQNNRLTQVPERLISAPYLITLQLDGNHISFVERHTIINSRLTHLHVAHNRIIRVETEAFLNSSLSHLDLTYNRLTNLGSKGLRSTLNQLKVLKLSGNSLSISELSSILVEARNLHHLGLGDVGLTGLPPDLLFYGRNLRHLNISANYLSSLPTELFVTCPNLQVLDLSLNNFRGLSDGILDAISRSKYLRVLRLEGNPWFCDHCHVSPLLKWLHGAPDQESGCEEPKVWTCLKCIGPPSFSGLELALLPPGDLPLCTTPSTTSIPLLNVLPTKKVVLSLADEPEFPRGELTRQNTERSDQDVVEILPPWTIEDLIRDRFYTIIIATCVFLVCLFFLVIIAVVAYHRQSAHYYTHENDITKPNPEQDQGISRNNNNKSPRKQQKKASIATIDEVRDIAGSTELVDVENGSSKNKQKAGQKVKQKAEKVQVSKNAEDAYQTVVDELGRTKLCKISEPLIQILDAEPRPGNG